MGVIGSAELLVSSRLDPKFAADLKRQVAAAGAKVGAGGIPPVKIAAQLDLKTATSNLQKFGQLQARADNENLARAKKIADAKSRTARQEQADIQRLGNLQSRALRENALFDEKKLGASLTRGGNFFQRFQEKANASLGKVGLSVRSLALATGAGFLAGDILALAIRGVISAIGSAITNFSNLNESVSASKAIFGSAAGTVDEFSKGSVAGLGLSSRAARETANSLGLLIQNAGATEAVSARMSTSLVALAADVASLQNVQGGAAEVAKAFSSALAGESEPARRLGIDTRIAALQQLALAEGVAKVGQELNAQQKSFLAVAAIVDGTKKSEGDFARTAGELANALRISSAAGEEASAALGESLQPAALSATRALTGLKLVLADLFKEDPAEQQSFLNRTLSKLSNPLGIVGSALTAKGKSAEEGTRRQIEARSKLNDQLRADAIAEAKRFFESEQSLQKRADAIRGLIGSENAYKQARIATADAIAGVEVAERRLDAVRRDQVRHLNEIERAKLGVAQADLGQKEANFALRQSEIETADIASGIDRQERQLDVTINLQEATLALVRAQNDQIRSQLQLQRLSLTSYDISLRLVNATRAQRFNIRELMSAQIDQREAALDLTESQLERGLGPNRTAKAGLDLQRAQREASRFNEVQTLREGRATLELERARLAVTSAALDQAGAEDTLNDAHIRTRDLEIEVAAAERGVAGARLSVVSATDAQASALVTWRTNQALARGEQFTMMDQLNTYVNELGPLYRNELSEEAKSIGGLTQGYKDAKAAYDELQKARDKTPQIAKGVGLETQGNNGAGKAGGFWKDFLDAITSLPRLLSGNFQHGGPLPGFQHGGIPGAAHGRKVRQESLIRIGEAGPEILAIRPGHRPEIIPNGGKVESGGRPINVQVNQVANDPEATAFAVATRLGREVTA